ncbi:Uma2 family endonuclease [filamentous cyanobacterium LEGE 11480]|uniref:Uma2 family endonuclease n=1 Tax=Romeriopsis navalis LEGE 11480 TaxID=2777977 RepID=A0A928VWM8_9CYAN|nr:Uma2 family endonuclease [Romeriopsis navalis]MBE9033384.1 Uma2 family endonuclease [Romeriopsis navalis LEGE 11480]
MTVATDRPIQQSTDQLLTLQGEWAQFQLIRQGCEKTPGVRLFYFDGTIEILMPGQLHETFSRIISWMLGTFFLTQTDLDFTPTGSVTQERAGEASAQANESYCIGQLKPIPDLAIEIVFTSGHIDKLDRDKALGITEVWFWEDGTLKLYHLKNGDYAAIETSELPGLSNLDLDLFKRCVLIAETDARESMQVFSQTIGAFTA